MIEWIELTIIFLCPIVMFIIVPIVVNITDPGLDELCSG